MMVWKGWSFSVPVNCGFGFVRFFCLGGPVTVSTFDTHSLHVMAKKQSLYELVRAGVGVGGGRPASG